MSSNNVSQLKQDYFTDTLSSHRHLSEDVCRCKNDGYRHTFPSRPHSATPVTSITKQKQQQKTQKVNIKAVFPIDLHSQTQKIKNKFPAKSQSLHNSHLTSITEMREDSHIMTKVLQKRKTFVKPSDTAEFKDNPTLNPKPAVKKSSTKTKNQNTVAVAIRSSPFIFTLYIYSSLFFNWWDVNKRTEQIIWI